MSKIYMSQHEWHQLVQHTNARMIFFMVTHSLFFSFCLWYIQIFCIPKTSELPHKKKNIITVNIIVIHVTKEYILIPVHMIGLITMNVHTFTENSDNVCCKDHIFLWVKYHELILDRQTFYLLIMICDQNTLLKCKHVLVQWL